MESFMALLRCEVRRTCLTAQRTEQSREPHLISRNRTKPPYRASGLVPWPQGARRYRQQAALSGAVEDAETGESNPQKPTFHGDPACRNAYEICSSE